MKNYDGGCIRVENRPEVYNGSSNKCTLSVTLSSQAQWQRALSQPHKVILGSKEKGLNQQCIFSYTCYLLSLAIPCSPRHKLPTSSTPAWRAHLLSVTLVSIPSRSEIFHLRNYKFYRSTRWTFFFFARDWRSVCSQGSQQH